MISSRPKKSKKTREKKDKHQGIFVSYITRTLRDQAHPLDKHPHLVNEFAKKLFDFNGSCQRFIQTVNNIIEGDQGGLTLSRKQKGHFSTILLTIPLITDGLDLIIQYIIKNPRQVVSQTTDHVNVDDYVKELEPSFIAHKQKIFNPVDDRVHLTDDRRVRRMDSLARLFRVKAGLSVCNAAAVHNGELLLAFNASDNMVHQEISTTTQKVIKLLEKHLSIVKKHGYEGYLKNHDPLNESTYKALANTHSMTFSEKLMTQALSKISNAIFFDGETLSHEERFVLQRDTLKYSILMPYLNGAELTILQIKFNGIDGEPTSIIHKVNLGIKVESISTAHAEQILAYFVFNIEQAKQYSYDNPLPIGITKLCCQGCTENLHSLPVAVRGHHGEADANTINFFPKTVQAKPKKNQTPKKRKTDAHNSPPNSGKKEGKPHNISRAKDVSTKRLIFGNEEPLSHEMEKLAIDVSTRKKQGTHSPRLFKQDDSSNGSSSDDSPEMKLRKY